MVWPVRLMVIYPLQAASAGQLVTACGVLAAITAAALLTARRRPYLAVGWFWYLGMLVPVLGLVQVGVQARADRYTYLPLVGVFIAVSWGLHDLLARVRMRATIAGLAAGVTVLSCAVAARQQVTSWQNGVALWQRATELSLGVDAYRAHVLLGNTLREQRRYEEALAHFSEAVRLKPELAEARYDLGLTQAAAGQSEAALASFADAVRIDPASAEAQREYGLALQNSGRPADAIAHYQEALRLQPGGAELESNLGSALAAAQRIGEALPHFAEAVRLRPDFEVARVNLAIAHLRLGHQAEAIAELREVLRRNPAQTQARALLDQATRAGK
jgi:tetratricopeptide (TPR) repeat protein